MNPDGTLNEEFLVPAGELQLGELTAGVGEQLSPAYGLEQRDQVESSQLSPASQTAQPLDLRAGSVATSPLHYLSPSNTTSSSSPLLSPQSAAPNTQFFPPSFR